MKIANGRCFHMLGFIRGTHPPIAKPVAHCVAEAVPASSKLTTRHGGRPTGLLSGSGCIQDMENGNLPDQVVVNLQPPWLDKGSWYIRFPVWASHGRRGMHLEEIDTYPSTSPSQHAACHQDGTRWEAAKRAWIREQFVSAWVVRAECSTQDGQKGYHMQEKVGAEYEWSKARRPRAGKRSHHDHHHDQYGVVARL